MTPRHDAPATGVATSRSQPARPPSPAGEPRRTTHAGVDGPVTGRQPVTDSALAPQEPGSPEQIATPASAHSHAVHHRDHGPTVDAGTSGQYATSDRHRTSTADSECVRIGRDIRDQDTVEA